MSRGVAFAGDVLSRLTVPVDRSFISDAHCLGASIQDETLISGLSVFHELGDVHCTEGSQCSGQRDLNLSCRRRGIDHFDKLISGQPFNCDGLQAGE